MDMKHIRVEGFRTAMDHWTAKMRATHLPSGFYVDFECDWRNHAQKREEALKSLAGLVNGSARIDTLDAVIMD